jgi:hypothetical protein
MHAHPTLRLTLRCTYWPVLINIFITVIVATMSKQSPEILYPQLVFFLTFKELLVILHLISLSCDGMYTQVPSGQLLLSKLCVVTKFSVFRQGSLYAVRFCFNQEIVSSSYLKCAKIILKWIFPKLVLHQYKLLMNSNIFVLLAESWWRGLKNRSG